MMNDYILASIGGLLIGLAATLMLWALGRISGVSGIFWAAISRPQDGLWRLAFLLGLPLGAGLFHWLSQMPPPAANASYIAALVGGFIVGIGVQLGSGCTSGHGVCGIARLSPRSIIATIIFMLAGIISVTLIRFFSS
ncbi:YeeE/YedE family protein [Agarilytica rhodophyticola]|uniref:YeeE/YedE family protein n=1 Tax=Agarilytica rhodophyticola TaxID=1737490 RepID=UPI001FE3552F|nr:YeeE/YedE thiosulfate transporter family protein [Agarilytica rhodophyticola]